MPQQSHNLRAKLLLLHSGGLGSLRDHGQKAKEAEEAED
jgi:hypothetical protein